MDFLLYWAARSIIGIFQLMPLDVVARVGRGFGALAYHLDARHRKKTIENLAISIPGKSKAEVEGMARECFKRIGESFCSAVKTSTMDWEDLKHRCEISGLEHLPKAQPGQTPQNCIVAIGHFANFEIWARFDKLVPGYQSATTYRGLRQPSLNRLLQDMRTRSGCLFFERRTEGAALKAALARSGLMLGILSDQHAGDNGLHVPFFGRLCSTTAAPAVFALRYRCPLHVGICYRIAPGRWKIEISESIPVIENGEPRSSVDIMTDINKRFETAILRDPANWFWVHNRWKLKPSPQTPTGTAPAQP